MTATAKHYAESRTELAEINRIQHEEEEARVERLAFLAHEEAECAYIDAMSEEDAAAWFAANDPVRDAAYGWAYALGLKEAA
jgi:hypothetical protein